MINFSFNDIRLRNKLLIMYVLSVLIPIVLTNVIFYHVTATNIKNQKIRDANFALEKTIGELQTVFDEAVGISYHFYLEFGFNEIMNRTYDTPISYIEAYEAYLRGPLSIYSQTYDAVGKLTIYTSNDTILTSGNIERLTEDVMREPWYRSFNEAHLKHPTVYFNKGSFSMIQALNHYDPESPYTHILKIDLNRDEMSTLFQHSPFDGQLYLTGPDNRIAFSTDPFTFLSEEEADYASIPISEDMIPFEMTLAEEYMRGWTLHGIMNERYVLEEVHKSRSFVLYLAIINFVLPTIIIALISRSVNTRLVRILKHMKKVKSGTFEPIPKKESRDEIGQLTMEFNRMTNRIKSLIDDVYIADIEKKDLELKRRQTQLRALHSQINPHFLFNALETIRMRSLMKGEKETAKIIMDMSKIFRKSITWGQDWVSIKDEIELIVCFLEIQKYRFGDKLEYTIHVDEELRELTIPKMTFLPFVENASIHGIEKSPFKGLITIDISQSGDDLVFRLTDNGIGMDAGKREDILGYLQQEEEEGRDNVGMKNAYARLRMCYKEEFHFSLESEPGAGTKVEIRLPMIY
ncbi:sensor histidine kinase [Paenibacillus nanensis]|uniref:Sensor histidine kinase n=1 Tax=Paenibacillus nanensis TaxID=393251 RepID=A0A3A1UQG6_9BACL|nr:sensor histidine kinase [Paenibacillus nanensis]RIX50748.1 sensor histidine kinase [Paenibacillus nanensis]